MKINQIQKKIVEMIPKQTRGRLLLSPRFGKTKIIIDYIKKHKFNNILWVTPSAKLANEDILKEFIKWRAKTYSKNLETVTYASLDKVVGGYDLIVLDEEQHLTENNSINLLSGELSSYSVVSMTGTPTKDPDKLKIINSLGLDTLYDVSIGEAVDMDILANYGINVVEIPLSNIREIEVGKQGSKFKVSEKDNYKFLCDSIKRSMYNRTINKKFLLIKRLRTIKESPSKERTLIELLDLLKGQRNLVFCSSINQADRLFEHTYHSKTDDKDLIKFQEGIVNQIGMVNSGGTGFTYKSIDNLIIVQADSDTNGGTSQRIARTLLKQDDYKANIWILCLSNTQDEVWVKKTLENFDITKTKFLKQEYLTEYANQ